MERHAGRRKTIVITVEGLNLGLVGAYGSSTSRTPSLDRLAAYGTVLDHCFVDSLALSEQLLSLWTGTHALQSRPVASDADTLWRQCNAAHLPASLITDCEFVANFAELAGCENVSLIEPTATTEPVEDVADASVMQLFLLAAQTLATEDPIASREDTSGEETGALESSEAAELVWIHSRGLKHPWDAPLELRQAFVDPEDPEPPTDVGPPAFLVDADTDPDLVVGWGQIAAAQTALIDEGLGALRAAIALRSDRDDWSWLLHSLDSVPLGERGQVGWSETGHEARQLHCELLGCIAMIEPANWQHDTVRSVGGRCAELFQLPDLGATIFDLLNLSQPGDAQTWGQSCLSLVPSSGPNAWPLARQLAVVRASQHAWIRCPAWSAILERKAAKTGERSSENLYTQDVAASDASGELYVKPDDRWEISDIASRRYDVLELIADCFDAFCQSAQSSSRGNWPTLHDDLKNLLR